MKYETFLTNLAIKWHDAIDSSSISLEVRSIYKNSDGIALGRPYNPGPRMRFLGINVDEKIKFLTYKKVYEHYLA